MDMLILLGGEVFLAVYLAADGAGDVVAGVADTLYLAYLAQHGAYLGLRLVAQVGIAHLVEIVGYLYLHVVGDALVFLDAREELHKLVGILLSQQLPHHAEHALYALGKGVYFLLGLMT